MCHAMSMQFCVLCPPQAYCAGGDADPTALTGYFQIDRITFQACIPEEACPGGDKSQSSDQCALGYKGVPCSQCIDVRPLPLHACVRTAVVDSRVLLLDPPCRVTTA